MSQKHYAPLPVHLVAGHIGPSPGPAPLPDGPPASLLGLLRPDLLLGSSYRCTPALAVLLTFGMMVMILALYLGLCVAIFAIP